MKKYTTEKGTGILFVEVPEDAIGLRLYTKSSGTQALFYYGKDGVHWLEGYDWQLLGRLSEISEEQAAGIVKSYPSMVIGSNTTYFKDYKTGGGLNTATESLNSLAASLNVKDNVVVLVKNK